MEENISKGEGEGEGIVRHSRAEGTEKGKRKHP